MIRRFEFCENHLVEVVCMVFKSAFVLLLQCLTRHLCRQLRSQIYGTYTIFQCSFQYVFWGVIVMLTAVILSRNIFKQGLWVLAENPELENF